MISNGVSGGTVALNVNMGGTNGLVTLKGTNNYTGATTVSHGGGSLQIDSASALPSTSTITLLKLGTSSGTLKLNTSGTNTYTNTFAKFQVLQRIFDRWLGQHPKPAGRQHDVWEYEHRQ